MSNVFNEVKDRLSMSEVALHFGFKPNQANFIYSPFHEEKTPSCKLYSKSFFDFSAGIGGDLTKFAAVVLHITNWQAVKYLCEVFSLPIALSGTTDIGKAQQQQAEQQKQNQRKQEFKTALSGCIADLKHWAEVYQTALENNLFEPFTDEWCYCVDELQKIRVPT